ncbi:MAG: hypothetical protein PHV23_02985 [Candidatus Gracilibacteria bacterium]|nr:hypothetical protein [Candidatus Gracilibacteria bacterium]
MINEAKTMLYEKLGIDNDQNNNSALVNFEKGIVDTMILDNYDLAIQVWETNGKILIDSLKQLASFEGLKKMAESLGESIWNLLSGNAYERGKSVAELGLITTGVGAGVYVGKKGFKLGMKEISKLRKPAERVVEGKDVKSVISETRGKVDEIVPKKELDFEKELENNFPEEKLKELKRIKQKIEDNNFINNRLPLKEFENLDLDGKLDVLGISKEYYDLLNNSGLLPEGFNIIERYKKLQYRDQLMPGKEVINYQDMIKKAIKKYPHLTKTEALLIFASTDKFLFENLNFKLRKQVKLTDGEQKLLDTFNSGLDKLPDLEGSTLRGDKWAGWIVKNPDDFKGISNLDIFNDIDVHLLKRGDNIPLYAPTYVSNNINDIFIIPEHVKNHTLVIINGMEGKVKDISSIAMFPNFAEKLGYREIGYEGVVKPNSLVEVESIKQIKKELPDGKGGKFIGTIIEVKVKQIK